MSRLIGTAIVVWLVAALAILSPPSIVKGQVPMTGAGLGAPASSGPAAVTWDPANTDSNITLSSGNLTASGNPPGGTNYLSRATGSVGASSKIYWEVLNVTDPSPGSNDVGLGFVDSSFTIPQNNFLGFDSHSYGYYSSGNVFTGGSQTATWSAYSTVTNLAAIAVDTVNSKWWGKSTCGGLWNNDATANPATNTNGLAFTQTAPLYPALVFRTSGPSQVTAQFSAASFSCSVPSGFTHL